jgi:hypothetical protein
MASHDEYETIKNKKSDYMAGQVLCDDPVTVVTIQSFWQHLEFALYRFVGI